MVNDYVYFTTIFFKINIYPLSKCILILSTYLWWTSPKITSSLIWAILNLTFQSCWAQEVKKTSKGLSPSSKGRYLRLLSTHTGLHPKKCLDTIPPIYTHIPHVKKTDQTGLSSPSLHSWGHRPRKNYHSQKKKQNSDFLIPHSSWTSSSLRPSRLLPDLKSKFDL